MRWTWLAVAVVAGCGARTSLGTRALGDASSTDATDAAADAPSACVASTLAQTDARPDAIAIDGEFVYWHDATGVFRVKKTGGAPETVASAAASTWPDLVSFAIGGGHVFYADGSDARRAPLGGGTSQSLGVSFTNPGFAASATHLYLWQRLGSPAQIVRGDFSGQGFTKADTLAEPPNEMVFDGETGYAAADPGVYRLGDDALLSGLTATDLVVVGKTVYFTSDDATNGARVMQLDTETLKQSPVADTFGAFAIARDDQDLYITDGNGLRVRRVVGMTGPVADVAATGSDYAPIDLVVDASCIYFTMAARNAQVAPGQVAVVPKP